MKALKVLSASVVAATLAATMCITASAATTYKDCVAAANECGVPAHNVQQLENFLEKNDSHFSSADYDDMIADMKNVCETYIKPICEDLGYDVATLTEEQKVEVGRKLDATARKAIEDDLIALGDKYGVEVNIDDLKNGSADVTAEIVDSDAGNNNSNGNNSSSKADATKKDSAVSPTGGVAETDSNATAIAFGGIATILAAAGIVVVAKKNKE